MSLNAEMSPSNKILTFTLGIAVGMLLLWWESRRDAELVTQMRGEMKAMIDNAIGRKAVISLIKPGGAS